MSSTAVAHVSTVKISLLRAGRTELRLRKYYIVKKGMASYRNIPPQFDSFPGVENILLAQMTIVLRGFLVGTKAER